MPVDIIIRSVLDTKMPVDIVIRSVLDTKMPVDIAITTYAEFIFCYV